jgi:hypothetical protein
MGRGRGIYERGNVKMNVIQKGWTRTTKADRSSRDEDEAGER